MPLHTYLKPLLDASAIKGFMDLHHLLKDFVDEDKIDSIVQEIIIKHNDFAREGNGFSPVFTLTEIENGVKLNYHRPNLNEGGPGDVYGSVNLECYRPQGSNYPLLRIEAKSWETLDKKDSFSISFEELKTKVDVLAPYLDAFQHSLARQMVRTFGRVTAGQRRIYVYDLTLNANGLMIHQLRNKEVISSFTLSVPTKTTTK
jgi:hypothetical protein